MHRINRILIAFLVLFLAILQITILDRLRIGYAKPDLLFIAVVYFALSEGTALGWKVGLFAGLLKDATTGGGLFLNTIIFGLWGFGCGSYYNKLYKDTFHTQAAVTFLAALSAGLFYFILADFLITAVSFASVFWVYILPSSIYTSLVSPVLFACLNKIARIPR